MGWGVDDGGAFDETMRAAGYAGVFALAAVAPPGPQRRVWLAGLAIGVVAVSVLALGSRMIPSLFPTQDVVQALPEARGRLSYPLGYWNGLGALLALGSALLLCDGRARAHRAGQGTLPRPPSRSRRSGVFLHILARRGRGRRRGAGAAVPAQPLPLAPGGCRRAIAGIAERGAR